MARLSHTCTRHENYIYMLGGCDNSVQFSDFWRLHVPTLTWERLDHNVMGTWGAPAFFHSCTVTATGQLITFGGVTSKQRNRRTNAVCTVRVVVPPLQELCAIALRQVPGVTAKSLKNHPLPNVRNPLAR